jgi:hypothetical protein
MPAGETNYPASLDTTTNLPDPEGVELDGDGDDNKVHSNLHSTVNSATIALETKVGSGASTPASGKILGGTGAGTSSWRTASEAGLAEAGHGHTDKADLTGGKVPTTQLGGAGASSTKVLTGDQLWSVLQSVLPLVGFALHGSNASFTRPTGFSVVIWFGTVTPTNAVDNDLYINLS